VSHPVERKQEAEPPRYDFAAIDLQSGSTHADVVLLTGANQRVLELGPATGYMSQALRERGCTVVGIELDAGMAERAAEHVDRLIVGDIQTLDLEEELGDERFDVIVAADVLEHLVDPLAVIRRLLPFLDDGGAFVLSVPNIAHGSVRLALLEGAFDYQDVGLLDRTHKTFFTRQSLERMLDEADLGVAEIHRHELNLEASEVRFDGGAIPDEVRRHLDSDLDARTYQFVVKAIPMGRPGLRELQRRLREQALALADAERAYAALAKISSQEGELRRALIESRDELLAREYDLERVRFDLETERELRRGDQAWNAELTAAMEAQQQRIRELTIELRHVRRTSPVWIAAKLRSMFSRSSG
jgi:2-polyprenyl-3-methyl-5-hydroxy-6-metoxy-1,4-benzoquinol methylase